MRLPAIRPKITDEQRERGQPPIVRAASLFLLVYGALQLAVIPIVVLAAVQGHLQSMPDGPLWMALSLLTRGVLGGAALLAAHWLGCFQRMGVLLGLVVVGIPLVTVAAQRVFSWPLIMYVAGFLLIVLSWRAMDRPGALSDGDRRSAT